MTLLALVLALVIEQAKPLPVGRIDAVLHAFGDAIDARFNAGEWRQGLAGWLIGVALPAASLFVLQIVLARTQWSMLLVLDVGVLYLTMGFRQFSHFFTDIHLALRMGEIDRARRLLAEWSEKNTDNLSSSEVARLSIEQALVASHRHVLAPLLWFAAAGPAGAVFYRLALAFKSRWGERNDPEFGEFGRFARQAFDWIDWLPVRLTATAFAVVGDFEDALYCWRSQSGRWSDIGSGILLASGAGALGVRLGMPLPDSDVLSDRPELGLGDEADADLMQSTVGLVWRTLVLILLLLALLWVASWVGG